MKYYIYIENRMVAEVAGCEAAWEAYRKTCELADLLGKIANLVDGETGEVIQSSDDWDDYDEDYEPDSEMGFDPYMGCYVTYCANCKHFDMREMECKNNEIVTDNEGGADFSINFGPDDFCSYGERRYDNAAS